MVSRLDKTSLAGKSTVCGKTFKINRPRYFIAEKKIKGRNTNFR